MRFIFLVHFLFISLFFKAGRVEFAKTKKNKNKKGYHSAKSNKISVIIDSKLFVINMTLWLIDKVKLNFSNTLSPCLLQHLLNRLSIYLSIFLSIHLSTYEYLNVFFKPYIYKHFSQCNFLMGF